MSKSLDEKVILEMTREEWEKRVSNLIESIDTVFKTKNGDKNLISPNLKVKHKKSKILYTVDSVSSNDVILRTPEGKKFLVDKEPFEQDYELD